MALLIFGLTACGYIPRPVEGVPPGAPWEALPLRKWLAEDRAEPQALAFCAPPECQPGLVVAVVDLTGRDADITQALLADPSRLSRALRSPPAKPAKAGTLANSARIQEGTARGFTLTLAPATGDKPPVHGAALGLRAEGSLKVVLVIGDDEPSVLTTVRQVARRELGV